MATAKKAAPTPTKKEVTQEDEDDKEDNNHPRNSLTPSVSTLLELGGLIQLSTANPSYDSITKLDLFQCNLSTLPKEMATELPQLSILFLSFKCNSITSIHPNALQSQLRWLILTDNQLRTLPSTIGRCSKLQKLLLSGNQIKQLPHEMKQCTELELIRLASNALEQPPMVLFQLPKLAWLALSDNPSQHDASTLSSSLKVFDDPHLDDPNASMELLGKGASGITRKYQLHPPQQSKINHTPPTSPMTINFVAVKEYYSQMTSNGNPHYERYLSLLASSLDCPNLISILGQTKMKSSLIMEYLSNYSVLANPPNFQSCTRDVYDSSKVFSEDVIVDMVSHLLNAMIQLHSVGICHGDFYAHNILYRINEDANEKDDDDNETTTTRMTEKKKKKMVQVKLTDFGASFIYPKKPTITTALMRTNEDNEYGSCIERVEVRAFGHWLYELSLLLDKKNSSKTTTILEQTLQELSKLCSFTTTTTTTKELSVTSFLELQSKWLACLESYNKNK